MQQTWGRRRCHEIKWGVGKEKRRKGKINPRKFETSCCYPNKKLSVCCCFLSIFWMILTGRNQHPLFYLLPLKLVR